LNPFFIIKRFGGPDGMSAHRIGEFRSAGAHLAPDRHADRA
jgi:hypothetical protein